MASSNSITFVNDLSEDMITEILLWLPVISLLRFRAVCKTWKALISSPKFIKFHLDRAVANNNTSIMFSNYASDIVSVLPTHLCCPESAVSLHIPPPFTEMHIVNSYSGIFCLGGVPHDEISLWNPSIKQYKYLPVPTYNVNAYDGDESITDVFVSLGFGFDSLSSDYKVVRVVMLVGQASQVLVELYSANADSWRTIQVQNLSLSLPSSCDATIKDVIYWVSLEGRSLVSFDLHNEEFGFITLPSCVWQARDRVEVADWKASVSIFHFSYGRGYMFSEVNMWTMDDECGKVSWTKKFKYLIAETICYVDDPEVYKLLRSRQFLATKLAGLFVYDDNAGVIKHAGTTSHKRSCAGAYGYTESLVSLTGFSQVVRKAKEIDPRKEAESGREFLRQQLNEFGWSCSCENDLECSCFW